MVIAIIHGGGFSAGSASDFLYCADPLVALEDVIIVSFNYRLGVLGFADMLDLAPGNLGLYDQRLALEWIQDNIQAFGGDSGRVTLMGVSAGSMSVSAQILTPLNGEGRQLFHAAIMDAGAIGPGIVVSANLSVSRMQMIAERLGCDTDGAEMVACLRGADSDELVKLSFDPSGYSPMFTFQPTVDGKFIPSDIAKYVRDKGTSFAKVKMLVGHAKDEGRVFARNTLNFSDLAFPELNSEAEFVDWCGKLAFGYRYPMDFASADVRRKVSDRYYQKNPTRFLDAAEFIGDGTFVCPINAFVNSYSKLTDNVFVYRFDRKLHQIYPFFDPSTYGAFHASLFMHMTGSLFRFQVVSPNTTAIAAEDEAFFVDAIRMVANFAKSNDRPEFRGTRWPDFSKGEGVLVFDDKPHVSTDLYNDANCREVFPFFEPEI